MLTLDQLKLILDQAVSSRDLDLNHDLKEIVDLKRSISKYPFGNFDQGIRDLREAVSELHSVVTDLEQQRHDQFIGRIEVILHRSTDFSGDSK